MIVAEQSYTDVAVFEHQGKRVVLESPHGDHIVKLVMRSGRFYELDLLEALRRRSLARQLKNLSSGIFVDCGAHVGNHTVFFGMFCPSTEIYAIEANSELMPYLAHNVATNKVSHAALIHACIGTGASVRFEPGPAGNMGMGRTEPGGPLPTHTLDEMFPEGADVVKLDLEGAEVRVLEAAIEWLGDCQPILAVESQDDSALSEVARVLEPLGYRREGPYAITPVWIWEVAP